MKTLFLVLCLCVVSAALSDGSGPLRTLLVRIDRVSPERLLKSGLVTIAEDAPAGVISLVRDTALVIMSRNEYELFRERGFQCSIVLEDTSTIRLFRRAAYGPSFRLEKPYHSYDMIRHELDSLQHRYPSLVRMFTIGRTTVGKRDIVAVKIASHVERESDRPSILFDGCHHSNELMGGEICLAIAHELTSLYGVDPQVTRWLDQWQIYIVPVVNVDGHEMVTSGRDPRWRKNTHSPGGSAEAQFPYGVDLNRNYDFNWAFGGSGDPSSDRYRGPFPFSESESRAFAQFAHAHRFLVSVTYHSFGEVVYYPWTWNGRQAPDENLLTSIARGLAGSIRTMNGDSTYRAEFGAGLVGQTYPWLYGTLGTFDFVVETGKGAMVFPPYEVEGIIKANLNGVRYMLGRVDGPGLVVRVKDAATGKPLEAEVRFPWIETAELRPRMTDPAYGELRRLLLPGTYECQVVRSGYRTSVLNDINVGTAGWTEKTVELVREGD